jgi:predicted RNA-binding protein with PIN domain
MHYVVDGNNVMGQIPGWHRDKPGARRKLLENLARFARVKPARVTVVFDGAPDKGLPDGSAYHGVKVLYAEKGSDADSRIVRLVESTREPASLNVVTSDRNLAFLVRSLGTSVLRSGLFRKLIEETIQNDREERQPEVEDVNEWLEYFGATESDDRERRGR